MVGQQTAARGAQVIFIPPPAYYAAGLVGGVLLDMVVPLAVGGRPATAVAGAVVGAAGVALTVAGVSAVIRHRTTIVPHHAVSNLITTGPYRLSRNPMYTGLAVLYIGLALVFGSWWPILLGPVVLWAIYRLVIRPEEEYLGERFGPAYARYRARVRRWL
ncbi:methyltransferase family protein [Hamadaea tsunoensis]|uniref:methyltransferase family protein n=1 Tax=Hamadaea tsunoensis TaxID=53368 RepID=UPI0004006E25|nr:isoprenylcysteine carboxylmethyltransferase family protein [Hamadaea tsunoensis]